jgi:lipopolysaccharide transport system ATP-binding protein
LEPEILVVDEVLAVGDAEFQHKCLGKMSDVAQEGRTVLFVSHNMSAILRLTQETIVLDQGKMVMRAPTPEAVDHYLNMGLTKQGERDWDQEAFLKKGRPLFRLPCGYSTLQVRWWIRSMPLRVSRLSWSISSPEEISGLRVGIYMMTTRVNLSSPALIRTTRNY